MSVKVLWERIRHFNILVIPVITVSLLPFTESTEKGWLLVTFRLVTVLTLRIL